MDVANVYRVQNTTVQSQSIALCASASDIPLGGGCGYPGNSNMGSTIGRVWHFGIYQDPTTKKWGYECTEGGGGGGTGTGALAWTICMKP